MTNKKEIFVTRTSLPPFEEYCAAIRPLWESRLMTNMGALHGQFSDALQSRCGCSVTLFSHGHLALEAALEVLARRGSEIITTPFTFVSTVHAIVRRGLTPVFCDVLPSDGTLDPAGLEALITPRTAAILPVHVYGNPCDVDAIDAVARRHGIPVIYDAAHAFDVRYQDRPLVTFGDASVLSFHATKVFSTVEGGAVCYGEDAAGMSAAEFAVRLDDCKNFGIRDEETCVSPGGNAKLNELQAAMGLCNLRHFDEAVAARGRVVAQYLDALKPLFASGAVSLLLPREGTRPNYAYFPVLFASPEARDKAYTALREAGIHPRKYFWPPVTETHCYRSARYPGADDTPVAHDLSARVLCLPLYDSLTPEDVRRIVRTVAD